ncbi:hypothetical protein [uncultured Winogradskyella sp.]|uniref:hypothetical protein n=1 Tax=uncultured Winogradskyella sp. TaxID=395353 RepID=UPI00262D8B7E|nr:hypothetical protein [uncultured Winogradskyella sp.]
MKRVTKTSTLKGIEEIYSSAITKILETIGYKYDVPDSINVNIDNKIAQIGLYSFKEDDQYMIHHLQEKINTLQGYTNIVYEMALVYCIAQFEAFLNDLTRLLLTYYWKTLITKHKTMSYEDVLKFETMEELKFSLIDKEVMAFSHLSIMEKVKYYEDRFHVKFSYIRQKGVRKNWNCIEKETLVKSFATRNIILHNGGVINEKYIFLTGEPKSKIGSSVTIDNRNSMDLMSIIFRVCDSFYQVSKNKVKNIKK